MFLVELEDRGVAAVEFVDEGDGEQQGAERAADHTPHLVADFAHAGGPSAAGHRHVELAAGRGFGVAAHGGPGNQVSGVYLVIGAVMPPA